MVSEESIHLHASRDPNNATGESLESNFKVAVTANESLVHGDIVNDTTIITQKEEDGESSQMLTESVELAKPESVGHIRKMEITPSDNEGPSSTAVDQRELGTDEMDGVGIPIAPCNNKESSIRVLYNCLPSHSKRKLEEVLLQWSDWHAKHCSSTEVPGDSFETGEETYFPALHVGSDKLSTVSVSMDVHVWKRQRKEAVSVDQGSSMYDRGFASGLASDEGGTEDRASYDWREAPRCFNCASYNHPLSECSKPRDNAAVNSARKQFLSKKSLSTGPRVPTRYYQETPGGKFDGLKPGVLSAETKKVLGLGELDPPPWLNRMRELGYPPGYLDREEDQPSGITIFGDEETHSAAMSNGLASDAQKAPQKMAVDFPGINALIPENADQWRWAEPPRAPLASDSSPWNHSHSHSRHNNYARDSPNNGLFHNGYKPWNHSQSSPHHYGLGSNSPVPYHSYDYHPSEPFSPRGVSIPGSPNYGRSFDTGKPFLHFNYGSF